MIYIAVYNHAVFSVYVLWKLKLINNSSSGSGGTREKRPGALRLSFHLSATTSFVYELFVCIFAMSKS